MSYTIVGIRAELEEFGGEDGSYKKYLSDPIALRHFKAGANAAWRKGYDLERDERRYAAKHGGKASDAFADGFIYSASYM